MPDHDRPATPEIASAFRTFMGVRLRVAEGVLIPRLETELLGYTALALLNGQPNPHIIDMCAGSGNLACALATHRIDATVWCSDLSEACVALAHLNADALGVAERVLVHCGDLFEPLRALDLKARADAVVCNPPYIPSTRLDNDKKELLEREPRMAFDAGPFGLNILQRVVKEAHEFLKPGAPLVFEFGAGQHKTVRWLVERSGVYKSCELVADGEGVPRVAIARKGS